LEKLKEEFKDTNENIGIFKVKSANKWIEEAKKRPIPEMLFSEFWFEGELCILFADTNLGKSILAVQIGDSISRNKRIEGFKLEAKKQNVLYFDFELSDKQFENRYSNNFTEHYIWDNFERAEINTDITDYPDGMSFEKYLYDSLEDSISRTGAKIVIIDNITYLKSTTENAKEALPLMKHLKLLKSKYGLSILVLAHTPKRDLSKPITINDLQGSKMIINFCDSAFTIGESSSDTNVRYLKQIKQRNCEKIYDAGNVIVCEICKPVNFLQFNFNGYGSEQEHLKQVTQSDKESKIEKAKELSKEGKTQRDIATQLGIALGTVSKYLKK